MVRLNPDQHVLAAKKAGKSLNAWVSDRITREAQQELAGKTAHRPLLNVWWRLADCAAADVQPTFHPAVNQSV